MTKSNFRVFLMLLGLVLPLFSTTTMPYPWSFQETPKQLMVWGGIMLGGWALFGLSFCAGGACYHKYRLLKSNDLNSLEKRISDAERTNEDLREAGREKAGDIDNFFSLGEDVKKFEHKLTGMSAAQKVSKNTPPCNKCVKISQWRKQHKDKLNDTLHEKPDELAKLQNELAKLILNNEI